MTAIDGIRSFEGLRKRAKTVRLAGADLTVATLSDIIKSKRAANRDRDRAVLDVLEKALNETSRLPEKATGSSQEGN